MKLLLIALAGGFGTLARYGLSGLVQRMTGATFPWGTFVVNVAGCFLFGLVWSLLEERLAVAGQWRAIVLIGFMGAFTTFSSFAYDSAGLMRDPQWGLAALNVIGQNALGLTCLFLGLAAGRSI